MAMNDKIRAVLQAWLEYQELMVDGGWPKNIPLSNAARRMEDKLLDLEMLIDPTSPPGE